MPVRLQFTTSFHLSTVLCGLSLFRYVAPLPFENIYHCQRHPSSLLKDLTYQDIARYAYQLPIIWIRHTNREGDGYEWCKLHNLRRMTPGYRASMRRHRHPISQCTPLQAVRAFSLSLNLSLTIVHICLVRVLILPFFERSSSSYGSTRA
jgi:hypothetical protein